MAAAAVSEKGLDLKAVIVGTTGAIGECLLAELLSSKQFSQVVSLGRRDATVPEVYSDVDQKAEETSGRLQQHKIDFEQLSSESVGEHFKDKDVFFCTLGTTRRAAGSAEAFRRIDHDYVVKCAEIAKESGVKQMSLVSSTGANPTSFFLYLKTKGEIEEDLKKLGFVKASIFRPGFLDRGTKKRFVEKAAGFFMSSIAVGRVAKAMRLDAEKFFKDQTSGEAEKQTSAAEVFENAAINAICSDA